MSRARPRATLDDALRARALTVLGAPASALECSTSASALAALAEFLEDTVIRALPADQRDGLRRARTADARGVRDALTAYGEHLEPAIEALGEGEARGPAEDAAGAVVTPHACEVRAILKARADAAETRNAGASGRDASSRRRVGTRNAEARERADARLRLGDVASYCEACVAMGDWDAAIAAAPAVSLAYWAELAERRAKAIAREGGDAEQAPRMLLVSG